MSIALPAAIDWQDPALEYFREAALYFPGLSFDDVAMRCRGRLVYLATPFSRQAVDEAGAYDMGRALVAAARAARWSRRFAQAGVTAISPIVQAVDMVHADAPPILDPLDAAFWEGWCRPLLRASRVVVVPPIAGWQDSAGIWHEMRTALSAGCPVFTVDAGGVA